MTLVASTALDWKLWRASWDGGTLGGTPAGWTAPGYDDSGWDAPVDSGLVPTRWDATLSDVLIAPAEALASIQLNGLVWLVRSPTFELDAVPASAALYLGHDDAVAVYVNGVLVWSGPFNKDTATPRSVDPSVFVVGTNVVAVAVTNISSGTGTWGPTGGSDNPTCLELQLQVVEGTPEGLTTCGPFIFDVYAADADGFTFLETLCTATAKRITAELDGVGRGEFTINRYSSEATTAVLGTGGLPLSRLVKVRLEGLGDEPIFAFWLEAGDFTLLEGTGELGKENLHFSGRGALAYLDRGIMADRSFLTSPFVGTDPVDGVWTFERPDLASALGFLASSRNGTGSLLTSWALPSISPEGDDVLLVAFIQARPNEAVTLPAGWNVRVSQDTSGIFGDEIRYIVADKLVATGAPPYADVATTAVPVRWTAAQLGFRATGTPAPATAAQFDSVASTPRHTITATLDGPPAAGSVLLAYATTTTVGSGSEDYRFPAGWTILEHIPNGNTYTGQAVVAYRVADGTESDVVADLGIVGTTLTSATLLVVEYPILYEPLRAGEVLWWVVQELLEPARVIGTEPSHPIPQLTMDFTNELDSNGAAWEETAATRAFTTNVGNRVLGVAGALLGSGQLVIRCTPDLLLRAFNRSTYGEDLTGGAFGTGVVRWQRGANIADVLVRAVAGRITATHELVGGQGAYGHAALADASTRPHWEQYGTADTADQAALDAVGAADLAQRLAHAENVTLPVLVGNDPTAGRYLPGPPEIAAAHYWVGDFVTVATGSTDFDINEATYQIAGITITEGAASPDVRSLQVVVELGALVGDGLPDPSGGGYGSGATSSTGGGGGGSAHVHTQYQTRPEKGQPQGYAGLDANALVPPQQLGSGAVGAGQLALLDDQTYGAIGGGPEVPVDHGAMGAAETLDVADGTWHKGELDADCALTVAGFTVDAGLVALLRVTQDVTGDHAITWDADVVFLTDDQPAQTALEPTWYVLWSDQGDSTIYGIRVGGGLQLGTTVEDETTWGIAPAAGTSGLAADAGHTHGTPAEPTVAEAGHWEVVMSDGTSAPPVPITNEAEDDWIYGFVPD